jgi:hypothetical protein
MLRSLGDYDNTYSGGTTAMQLIKLLNAKESNRVSLLKIYINRYFRTYISLLSNADDLMKVQAKLPEFMCDYTKDIQKCIIDDYVTIGQYISADNMDVFSKLKFKYNIDEVVGVIGKQDQYNCLWDKVIKESEFTLSDAAEVLLYVLVSELGRFLEVSSAKKDQIVIGNFIITVFDMIIADDTIFNMKDVELNRYKSSLYQTQYNVYTHIISQRTLSEVAAFGEVTAEEMIEDKVKEEAAAKEFLEQDEMVEAMAREKYGPDAKDDMIEMFKEKYYKDKKAEAQAIRDQFDYKVVGEDDNEEVLEEGDDYSELPQEHGAADI